MTSDAPNPLERAAAALRAGTGDFASVIRELLRAPLAVPTAADPARDPFSPVLTDIDGVVHMVVASRPACLDRTSGVARYAISMDGSSVVAGVQAGFGLLVNVPGGAFNVTPQVLAGLREGRAGSSG